MKLLTYVRGKSVVARLLAGGLLLFCLGCQTWRDEMMDEAQVKPFYRPTNFNGEAQLPATLRRVLVLPVCGGRIAEVEATLALDEVLLTALQQKARFEVVTISREEIQRRFHQPEFSSSAVLPRDFMEGLGRAYGVEAVLFVDLTLYQPYPPLAVGFRAKLATVQEVRLVWSFDDSFSSTDPAVVNSVKHASHKDKSSQLPVDMTVGTFQSPRRFAAYAANVMFETLPPR